MFLGSLLFGYMGSFYQQSSAKPFGLFCMFSYFGFNNTSTGIIKYSTEMLAPSVALSLPDAATAYAL
jgi:hypothetical protein